MTSILSGSCATPTIFGGAPARRRVPPTSFWSPVANSTMLVESPFDLPLSTLDVVDVNAVRYDASTLDVEMRDAAGGFTGSAALAASLHGRLLEGIAAATLFVVGECTARLSVRPGADEGDDDEDDEDCGGGGDARSDCSSSISLSLWSSGAPGSSLSSSEYRSSSGSSSRSCAEAAPAPEPVPTTACGAPPPPALEPAQPADGSCDASGSSSGTGTSSSSGDDARMRFERLGYSRPEADKAADEFARDGGALAHPRGAFG